MPTKRSKILSLDAGVPLLPDSFWGILPEGNPGKILLLYPAQEQAGSENF
jgi:hypothetical protein